MAQWFLTALLEGSSSSSSTHTVLTNSATPDPGDLLASEGISHADRVQACMEANTYNTNKT